MKSTVKRLALLSALLVTYHLALVTAHAQGVVTIRSGATVPTNCTPKANNGLFYKNSGSNIGLYECTAANTWTYRGALNFGGALTPTALSGDVNDYSPTSLGSSFAVRINGGASDRNITGLATGSDGRLVMIINIGSTNTLTLKDASSSSTAANRFLFGADVVLGINQAVTLRYDGTSSRWRPFTEVLTSSGATAGSYGPAMITVDAQGRVTAASTATVTQMSAPAFCSDAGANDTYACSLAPAPGSYVAGTRYRFLANTANTGAATINFNSLGAKTIVKVAGGITTTLADNDIRSGQWVEVVYDGTNMQMQSLLGHAYGTAADENIGTSGANVSRLSGNNTWSGTQTFGKAAITPSNALTDNGTTIATDAGLGNNFRVSALTANVTLSNPTNPSDGQVVTWEVIQNAAAAKTLTFDTSFAFGAEITGCTISATLSSHNFLTAIYNSTATKWYVRGCITGY